MALLDSPDWADEAGALFDRMPVQQQQQQKQQRPVGEVCFDIADLPSEMSPIGDAGDSPASDEKTPSANGTGGPL